MVVQTTSLKDYSLKSLNKRIMELERRGWECKGPFKKTFIAIAGVYVYTIEMEREYNNEE